jgi:hypothetical protein
MRRLVTILGLLAVLGIGGFLYMFKREAVADLADSARGYPKAKTPQECVDLFKKAVKERKYDKAAKYCTKDYAEQLTKAAPAAKELGTAIDDLTHRMQSDGVLTSEIELVLFYNDPLPPALTMTIKTTGDKESTATLGVTEPKLRTNYPASWEYDARFVRGLYAYLPGEVRLVKDGEYWKIDFPVVPAQREQVDHVIGNHRDYVISFNKMAEEVRIERTTKAEVEKRFKELLTDAVRAKK